MRIVNPTGKKGEDLACEFLKKKEYSILERNFRKGYGEIDIICLKQNVLVFVEVKTRTSNTFGTPFEAIAPWKLKSLTKTAEYYSIRHPKLPQELRIDAIGVMLDEKNNLSSIEHKENISGF